MLDKNKHIIYAVKLENTLWFIVCCRSIINGLKALDDGKFENYSKSDVEYGGLWLVFKRNVGYYKIENNKLDWEDMELLILKSSIADWKRQVLLTGRKPVININ